MIKIVHILHYVKNVNIIPYLRIKTHAKGRSYIDTFQKQFKYHLLASLIRQAKCCSYIALCETIHTVRFKKG